MLFSISCILAANTHPAPNKYDTSGDMAFKTRAERPKSVAFKAKGYTAPYHARRELPMIL